MPFQLKPPVQKTFFLDKTDAAYPPEESNDETPQRTTVTVRQATQSQHERRNDLFSKMTSKITPGDAAVTEIVMRFSKPELERVEAFLALVDCNIQDVDGTPLFKFKDGRIAESQFNSAWGKLPPLVASEIHEKVLELNPTWGDLGEVQ